MIATETTKLSQSLWKGRKHVKKDFGDPLAGYC